MKESRDTRKPVAHTPLSRPIQTSNIVYPVASSTDDEGWTNISDDERVYVQDSSSEDDIRLETAPMKAEPRHRRQLDVENKGAKKDIHYYHGDSSLPVYARPASGISTSKAVSIIIHDHPDPAQVATAVPVGINANALFVMDKDKVGHYKNALADSMGSWRQTGKEMHYVSYNKHTSTCQVVKYLPNDRKFRCSAKAFRVHSGKDIRSVPGEGNEGKYNIANERGTAHTVSILTSATSPKITCSTQCARFNAFKLCSHTLALAEHLSVLPAYLAAYRARKTEKCNKDGKYKYASWTRTKSYPCHRATEGIS